MTSKTLWNLKASVQVKKYKSEEKGTETEQIFASYTPKRELISVINKKIEKIKLCQKWIKKSQKWYHLELGKCKWK